MEQITDNNIRLHYDLHLNLDPARHLVSVGGSLVYHAPFDNLKRASFFLNRQFDMQGLGGRGVMGYQYEKEPNHRDNSPFLPDAGLLDVYFETPLKSGGTALVQFEYAGQITEWPANSANVVTPDWVELGLNLPWFPLQYDGEPSNLTFSLQVTCPSDFQVASYGDSVQEGNTWFFNWGHPTNDIVVVAGRDLRSHNFSSESNRVLLHSVTFSDTTAHMLGEDLLWALERFAGWFGPIRPAEFTLIESPRIQGGGYARRGLVVLGGVNEHDYLTQRENYLRYLAHEAAHAWWWSAPSASWEDWLNESFAEYSALMAVRERYGVEAFNRRMERKREQVASLLPTGALPIWEFNRSDTITNEKLERVEAQLYHKGPLLLHELAERISHRRFFDLCRGMQWAGVRTTSHFLDLLAELEGEDTRSWMEAALKSQ